MATARTDGANPCTPGSDPTATVPFATYERWGRSQRGVVSGFEEGDAYIDFEPIEGTSRRDANGENGPRCGETSAFGSPNSNSFGTPRSPAIASKNSGSERIRGTLRWKPTAFGEADGER